MILQDCQNNPPPPLLQIVRLVRVCLFMFDCCTFTLQRCCPACMGSRDRGQWVSSLNSNETTVIHCTAHSSLTLSWPAATNSLNIPGGTKDGSVQRANISTQSTSWNSSSSGRDTKPERVVILLELVHYTLYNVSLSITTLRNYKYFNWKSSAHTSTLAHCWEHVIKLKRSIGRLTEEWMARKWITNYFEKEINSAAQLSCKNTFRSLILEWEDLQKLKMNLRLHHLVHHKMDRQLRH